MQKQELETKAWDSHRKSVASNQLSLRSQAGSSFLQLPASLSLSEALLDSLESGNFSLYRADPSPQQRTREELGAGRGASEAADSGASYTQGCP